MKKLVIWILKCIGRLKCSWRLFYQVMIWLPDLRRYAYWNVLVRHGVVARMCDEGFFRMWTLAHTGEKYALPGNGGGINSAINWQRLYWKSDLPVICSDKIAVREFVRGRIGDKYLIPMLPSESVWWTAAEDFSLEGLPDCFVLKLNNGSSMNLIVREKRALDLGEVRETLHKWLESDFSLWARERHYAKINNKVYCESFIGSTDGTPPLDYKFMCNNGKVLFAQIESDRFTDHRQNFYDIDFNPLQVKGGYETAKRKLVRPEKWSEMLAVAAKLSKGIPIVRIDLYYVHGMVYFGEMTFTPAACTKRYEPLSFSIGIGDQIDLKPFMGAKG